MGAKAEAELRFQRASRDRVVVPVGGLAQQQPMGSQRRGG